MIETNTLINCAISLFSIHFGDNSDLALFYGYKGPNSKYLPHLTTVAAQLRCSFTGYLSKQIVIFRLDSLEAILSLLTFNT